MINLHGISKLAENPLHQSYVCIYCLNSGASDDGASATATHSAMALSFRFYSMIALELREACSNLISESIEELGDANESSASSPSSSHEYDQSEAEVAQFEAILPEGTLLQCKRGKRRKTAESRKASFPNQIDGFMQKVNCIWVS